MNSGEKEARAERLMCGMLAELAVLLDDHTAEIDSIPDEPLAYVDGLFEHASDAYVRARSLSRWTDARFPRRLSSDDRHNCVSYVTPLAHAIKRIRQVVGLEVAAPVREPLRPCECVACVKALHWIHTHTNKKTTGGQ